MFTTLAFIDNFLDVPINPIPVALRALVMLLANFFLHPGTTFFTRLLPLLLGLLLNKFRTFLAPDFKFIFKFVTTTALVSCLIRGGRKDFLGCNVTTITNAVIVCTVNLPCVTVVLGIIVNGRFSLTTVFRVNVLLFVPKSVTGTMLTVVLTSHLGKRIHTFRR